VDEKDKIIAEQAEEIRILKELVAALTAKVAELTAQLNKNSKNSNKPPSSDGLKKGAVKNSRVPSGKASGGQPGHKGVAKELNPEPDTLVELNPKTKCECGGEITIQADNFIIRQVTDIQRPKVITVEYRAHEGVCTQCGKIHKAVFPEGVKGTVSYGDNLQALVTYLTTYQLIPLKRATELVKDLLGIQISQGTIVASEHEAYEKLEDPEARTKEELIGSEVVNLDETGTKVAGKTHWMHSAGTESCTMYYIHKKRGVEAMDEMGVLPLFSGTAIHDHWKSYYHYTGCAHGECNEHHLRTLKYIYEDLGEAWAGEMACLLLRIKTHVDLSKRFGADALEQEDIDTYGRLYRDILANAIARPQAPKESARMAQRLTRYEQETLLFMLDFDVPFTNNLAERDIRMPKAKLKISGGFRSERGAKDFARIRGFVSTVKKKGKNVFDGLVSVFNGNALSFLYPHPMGH
jgi:transposase